MRIVPGINRLRGIIPALAVSLGIVSSMQAAVQNRISGGGGVDGSDVAVPHSVHPRVTASVDQGEAAANLPLQTLSLRFNMTPAQQAALTQLLADQQDSSFHSYHKWLTPEQFAAEFGLSSADLATVSSWLTSQGFTIKAVARGGTFIQFSGTV